MERSRPAGAGMVFSKGILLRLLFHMDTGNLSQDTLRSIDESVLEGHVAAGFSEFNSNRCNNSDVLEGATAGND